MVKDYPRLSKHLTYSFLGGIATALGATVGFAIVIWIATFILSRLGGLPLVGIFFANIVDATTQALQGRRN
jgi:hypothetical protein